MRALLLCAGAEHERMRMQPLHVRTLPVRPSRGLERADERPATLAWVLRMSANGAIQAGLGDLRAELLAFLERRLGSRADAEDVFHDTVVRALEHTPPDHEEALRPWLYATLKHALVDRWRRGDVARRALSKLEAEPDAHDEALDRAVCACVTGALGALKPEQAAALRAVELDEEAVGTWAARIGITPNAASVRLHRARAALRRELARACGACATVEACVECSCDTGAD